MTSDKKPPNTCTSTLGYECDLCKTIHQTAAKARACHKVTITKQEGTQQ